MIPTIISASYVTSGGTRYINTLEADTVIAITQSLYAGDAGRMGTVTKINGIPMNVAYEDLTVAADKPRLRITYANWFETSAATPYYSDIGSTYVGTHIWAIKNGSRYVTFKGTHGVSSETGSNDCYNYTEYDINVGDLMLASTHSQYAGYSTDYPTLNYGWTKDTETVVGGGEISERSHHMLIPSSGSSTFYECVSYGAFGLTVVHIKPRSGGLVMIFHEQ